MHLGSLQGFRNSALGGNLWMMEARSQDDKSQLYVEYYVSALLFLPAFFQSSLQLKPTVMYHCAIIIHSDSSAMVAT